MGANLYGVANPAPTLIYSTLIGGANLACPAGTETNLLSTGTLITPSGGAFYPIAWVNLTFTVGATPPTVVALGVRISGGADLGTFNPNIALFVASTNVTISWCVAGPTSRSTWAAPGNALQISVNPTAQALTAVFTFSQGILGVLRAADI